MNKFNRLARKIAEKNQYLSLATVDSNNNPWISPVCYTLDESGNFYFVSLPGSHHSVNIKNNKNVAFSIFDSHQKWGLGIGLQIEGNIKLLSIKESMPICKLYIKRKYPYPNIDLRIAQKFIKKLFKTKKIYRFYKLTSKTVWMNNPYSELDERIEVKLD
jgi:uncharacterized protein YhbP (UPF0306 family)